MRIKTSTLITVSLVLITVALCCHMSGNRFFSVLTPNTIPVKMKIVGNKYQAKVNFIDFKADEWCGGDLYPHTFKVLGVKEEYLEDDYCYLKLDEVHSQPCYGRTWSWTIKNVILKTPLKNGVCDFFNEGTIANPETSVYKYTSYNGATGRTEVYISNCAKFGNCLDYIKYSSAGAKGLLYLKIKPGVFENCKEMNGNYCVDNKVEVRNYHCLSGYGTDENCFIGHCVYDVVLEKKCEWYQVCSKGECVTNPILEIVGLIAILSVVVIIPLRMRK